MATGGRFETPWAPLQRVLTIVLIGLSVAIVLDQANPLTTPMGRDSGVFAYIASHLLRGDTPYVFAWDHKPPLIYFINAAALLLGSGSRWGIWAMELIWLSGAFLAGFVALRRRYGWAAALAGCGAALVALNRMLFGGNFTEEYSLLFSFVSLWLFGHILDEPDSLWPHAGLGLALAFTILLRPNNAGVQIAVLLTEALITMPKIGWRSARAALLWTGAGLLVPLVGVSAYFAARGAFTEFVEASFIYNLAYSSHMDLAGALRAGAAGLRLTAIVGAAGLALGTFRLRRQVQSRNVDPWLVWLALDAIIELLFSALSGRNFVHYFICWLPALAVAVAYLVSESPRAWQERVERAATAALVMTILLVSAAAWQPLGRYATTFERLVSARALLEKNDSVSKYVNAHTSPDETVFVWGGEVSINFLSRRGAPTAQILYGKLVDTPVTEKLGEEFMRDMQGSPPRLIVDRGLKTMVPLTAADPVAWSEAHGIFPQPHIEDFFGFLHGRYTLAARVSDMDIYVLQIDELPCECH
ncbi:MAG TPA: hypothetical protein VIU38_12885 [Anaerolineales bacterium]